MTMRHAHAVWVVMTLALAACDSDPPSNAPDKPLPPVDACQLSPGELPRPPAGGLPCELFPPGFEAARTE